MIIASPSPPCASPAWLRECHSGEVYRIEPWLSLKKYPLKFLESRFFSCKGVGGGEERMRKEQKEIQKSTYATTKSKKGALCVG